MAMLNEVYIEVLLIDEVLANVTDFGVRPIVPSQCSILEVKSI